MRCWWSTSGHCQPGVECRPSGLIWPRLDSPTPCAQKSGRRLLSAVVWRNTGGGCARRTAAFMTLGHNMSPCSVLTLDGPTLKRNEARSLMQNQHTRELIGALLEFMDLVFTHISGGSNHRQLGSLFLLYSWDVFLSANTCMLTWSTSYLRPCHAQGIYEEVSLDITISSKSFTSMGIILYHVSVVEICVKMCFTLDAGCTQQKGWDSITDPPTILHLQITCYYMCCQKTTKPVFLHGILGCNFFSILYVGLGAEFFLYSWSLELMHRY